MRPTLVVHIVAGSLGIIFGFIALAAAKGGRLHRKSGMVFVYAMITMALMGSFIAAVRRVAPAANVPVGLLTAYMVITALITVRPPSKGSRTLDVALMLFVAGVSLTLLTFGFRVLASETGRLYGMPAYPFLIFGTVGMLATIGDGRLIRQGGVHVVRGAPRLARHLWRMSFALLTAAFSFFLGQAKVIPKPIRIYPLLMIPPLVVLIALFYWLWRVRVRRSLRGMVVARQVEAQRA
jgi:uncharacterized membrane protein